MENIIYIDQNETIEDVAKKVDADGKNVIIFSENIRPIDQRDILEKIAKYLGSSHTLKKRMTWNIEFA